MPVSDVVEAVEADDVVLVLVNHNNFRDVADELTADMVASGEECIVFTTDRAFEELRDDLGFRDLDPEEYYILDLIAEKKGIEGEDEWMERISSPTAFNDISIAFTDLYDRMEGDDRVVILDSLTAWLLYGDLKEIGNFVKKMTDKAKDNGARFVILAMETLVDDDTIDRLMTFCDQKIDLSDERMQDDL
jgi:hypothetical protein